ETVQIGFAVWRRELNPDQFAFIDADPFVAAQRAFDDGAFRTGDDFANAPTAQTTLGNGQFGWAKDRCGERFSRLEIAFVAAGNRQRKGSAGRAQGELLRPEERQSESGRSESHAEAFRAQIE